MLRTFDRYLVRNFFQAYLICLVGLLGLYILVNALGDIDCFCASAGRSSLASLLTHYYSRQAFLYFDQLSEVITSLAVLFTFAWAKRNAELMPLVAAGVPIYRLTAPVLIAAAGTIGMSAMNRELIIPRFAEQLQRRPGDDGEVPLQNRGFGQPKGTLVAHDPGGLLITTAACYRKEQLIRPVRVTICSRLAGDLLELEAVEAQYVTTESADRLGGWVLRQVQPIDVRRNSQVLHWLAPDRAFLHTTITLDDFIRSRRWFEFESTNSLLAKLREPTTLSSTEVRGIYFLLHRRLTRPFAGIVMLLLTLPFVLMTGERGALATIGAGIAIGIVFLVSFDCCQFLATADVVRPELAAWLPLLTFGSVAAGMCTLAKT